MLIKDDIHIFSLERIDYALYIAPYMVIPKDLKERRPTILEIVLTFRFMIMSHFAKIVLKISI